MRPFSSLEFETPGLMNPMEIILRILIVKLIIPYQERKQDYNFLPEHVAFRIDFFDSFFQPVNLSFHSRTSCLFEFEFWLEFFDLQFETVLVSVNNVLALQGLDAWSELGDLLLQLVALLLDVGDSIGLLVNCNLKCFNWLI